MVANDCFSRVSRTTGILSPYAVLYVCMAPVLLIFMPSLIFIFYDLSYCALRSVRCIVHGTRYIQYILVTHTDCTVYCVAWAFSFFHTDAIVSPTCNAAISSSYEDNTTSFSTSSCFSGTVCHSSICKGIYSFVCCCDIPKNCTARVAVVATTTTATTTTTTGLSVVEWG
jgi:hypothetical protein